MRHASHSWNGLGLDCAACHLSSVVVENKRIKARSLHGNHRGAERLTCFLEGGKASQCVGARVVELARA